MAAGWGFRTSSDRYNKGAILISFRPDQGYALQAFDPQGRSSQYSVFSIDRQEADPVKIVDQLDTVLFAIGDTAAGNAQVSCSATGKLYEITPTDPFAGASVLPSGTRRFGTRVIGDGIHAPGGFGFGDGMPFGPRVAI